MGNHASSDRHGTGESAANASLEEIDAQRNELCKRQRRHNDQAERVLAQARAHNAQGNREEAFACLRRRQQMKEQAAAIGAMVETLDAHARSIETKLMTSEVMAVMKRSAKQLATRALSVDAVDDFMVKNGETLDDLRAVTQAIGTAEGGVVPSGDDEFLRLLECPSPTAATTVPAPGTPLLGPGPGPGTCPESSSLMATFNDDALFVGELEAQVTQLSLPCVPHKEVSSATDFLGSTALPPPVYTAAAAVFNM